MKLGRLQTVLLQGMYKNAGLWPTGFGLGVASTKALNGMVKKGVVAEPLNPADPEWKLTPKGQLLARQLFPRLKPYSRPRTTVEMAQEAHSLLLGERNELG